MSILSKSDYDYINLATCIKGQANRLGIEHEGIPLEGVVVRIANATPPGTEKADREPSEDPCPEWKCPDLSSEDRREGKTCPDHPCTCTREPSDATLKESAPDLERRVDVRSDVAYPSDAEVEAAADAIIEASFGQELPEAPADLARAALLAAHEVRRG